jgi:Tfp pilus assembly protein PilZ
VSVGTPDPLPDNRRAPRAAAIATARLEAGDLTLTGVLGNIAAGGVFFATQLLIEIGERGILRLEGDRAPSVPVRVIWLRTASHPVGPGMGLAFEGDPGPFLAAV